MELLPENGDSSNFVGTLRAYAFDFKDKDQALFGVFTASLYF